MRTLVVVNGERDWQGYLPGMQVEQAHLQTARWLWHDGKLWALTPNGTVAVDGVLWRVGAIRPHPRHRAVLEMIRLAGVPCVNPATTLLRGYDRLGMLNELREAGLPVQPFTVAAGEGVLDVINPTLPAVVKVGNLHGGLGKARPRDAQEWADTRDLAFVAEDYVTIEPYIDYIRDIRCLAVGDQMWAMARKGATWKANDQTIEHTVIPVPPSLAEYTRRAMEHLGADIIALDFLETGVGDVILLESNDVPGFSGFPDEVRRSVATLVRRKMESVAK